MAHPTWPLDKVAADINFDGIGTEVYGPVKRIVGFGAEHSDLGTVFEDVGGDGKYRHTRPAAGRERFRPLGSLCVCEKGRAGVDVDGRSGRRVSAWIPRMKKWMETDYHSPSDTVKPDWNWTGPQTLARLG